MTSTANAAAFTWQGYTRDSSWNCGPAGSTRDINGLYLLPCIKMSGDDWQAILIATAGSSGRYISDEQYELVFAGGTTQYINPGWCTGGTNYMGDGYIAAGQSLACFSPTVYSPNALVEGEFVVTVAVGPDTSGQPTPLYSPSAWTP
jgi:hypothetical protein